MVHNKYFLLLMFYVGCISASQQPAYRWQQQVIGTREEYEIIERFNKGQCGNCEKIEELMGLRWNGLILGELKDCVTKHTMLVEQSGQDFKNCVPILEKKENKGIYSWFSWQQQSQKAEQYTVPKMPESGYATSKKNVSDIDLDRMYAYGLLYRAQLYAQLHNELFKMQKKEQYALSPLHIELLFDVLEKIKHEHKQLYTADYMGKFLDYKKRWLNDRERGIIYGAKEVLEAKIPEGTYLLEHDEGRAGSQEQLVMTNEEELVSCARSIYIQNDLQHNGIPDHDIRLSDKLFGFDYLCLLEGFDVESPETLKFCWVTSPVGAKKEEHFCFVAYKTENSSRITKIELPKLSEHKYSVALDDSCSGCLRSSLISQDGIQSAISIGKDDITAMAYDPTLNVVLYGQNNILKAYENIEAPRIGHGLRFFAEETIDKIIVLDDFAYLIKTDANKLHRYFYGTSSTIKQLPSQDITDQLMPDQKQFGDCKLIDIAFDCNSKTMVYLTDAGVFTATLFVSKPDETLSATRSMQGDLPQGPDFSNWSVECNKIQKKNHPDFDITAYDYTSVDICNDQILVRGTSKEDGDQFVHVYPPLTAAAAAVEASSTASTSISTTVASSSDRDKRLADRKQKLANSSEFVRAAFNQYSDDELCRMTKLDFHQKFLQATRNDPSAIAWDTKE